MKLNLHADKLMQLKTIHQLNETLLSKWQLKSITLLQKESLNSNERVLSEESYFLQRNERSETHQLFTNKTMELQAI